MNTLKKTHLRLPCPLPFGHISFVSYHVGGGYVLIIVEYIFVIIPSWKDNHDPTVQYEDLSSPSYIFEYRNSFIPCWFCGFIWLAYNRSPHTIRMGEFR